MVLLYVLILSQINYCLTKRYDNYSLYRSIPINKKQVTFFKELEKNNIDFWKPPGKYLFKCP